MFQEEKPYLTPLPLEHFRYFKEETRTVQDDRTVQVNDSWYAARPARIGSTVLVRIFERELEIRDMTTMALLRRHPLAYKKGEVLLPDAERIFNPSRQTRQILRQAEDIARMPRVCASSCSTNAAAGGAEKHVGPSSRSCRACRPASSSRPPRSRSPDRSAPRRPCGSLPSSARAGPGAP